MNLRTLSVMALVAAWIVGTGTAFWAFEGRYMRPVSRPTGAATARLAAPPPATASLLETDRGLIHLGQPGPVTLLNFWNPDCPCSRFAEGHVVRLAAQYEPRGVHFVTLVSSDSAPDEQRRALSRWRSRGLLPADPAMSDDGNHLALALGVWAAPAAVILDRQGHTAFVGAYNAARYCDAARTAWAAQALAAVIRGQRPAHPKVPFYGCQLLAAQH